jgi:Flp pilus assembly protein TadG
MKIAELWNDFRGAAAIEFGFTAPFFFAAVFGIVNAGMVLWTQLGLQHGTEMASRCASVNAILCPDDNSIKEFARTQALGLNIDPSIFTVAPGGCGGVQVSASYPYNIVGFVTWGGTPLLSMQLAARSCFPK